MEFQNFSFCEHCNKSITYGFVFVVLIRHALWLFSICSICRSNWIWNFSLSSTPTRQTDRNDYLLWAWFAISTIFQNRTWQTNVEHSWRGSWNRTFNVNIYETKGKPTLIASTFAICTSHCTDQKFQRNFLCQCIKTDIKWQRTNTTEKQGAVLTPVCQNWRFIVPKTVLLLPKVHFSEPNFVLKRTSIANLHYVRSELNYVSIPNFRQFKFREIPLILNYHEKLRFAETQIF